MIFEAVLLLAGALQSASELPDPHAKWLEEEVPYIITDREREVFLELSTVEERDRFIQAFWDRRDPNPATPVNEFKEEHYKRIEYANEFLGRDTFRPGWRTDRGRYYILLGEPKIVQRFTGSNEIVDTELWFYQGGGAQGLPPSFYLLFYQRDGVGEYELYHPVADGPPRLFRGTSVVLPDTENLRAVELLEQISPDLAHASLSFDAGQPPDYMTGRASFATDALMARIEESPKRAVRTDYLDAFLRYRDRVAADYSFNFVPSRSTFAALAGPGGAAIVHYALELDPESFGLAFDEDQGKYYTTLDVTLEVRDPEGTLVLSNERSDYIELSQSQVQEIERHPIAYLDSFPLVPGRFTASVILRNRALKRYAVAEEELEVRDLGAGAPAVAGPILGHRTERLLSSASEAQVLTFQLGSLRIEPAADELFAIGDTVFAFAQAVSAPSGARLRFDLLLDGESMDWKEVELEPDSGAALAELSTLGAAGGSYVVRAQLLPAEGARLAESSIPFSLSPRSSIPRPNFVYRRGFNSEIPGLLALVLGDQWWNLGERKRAAAAYESSVGAGNVQLPQARWKLAHAYLVEGRTRGALDLLLPLESTFPSQYEVVAGLGIAYSQTGEDEKAIPYLERAIALRSPDTKVLNAAGASHERLGNLTEAKRFYARSLQLDSDQPAVRDRLSKLE